jgi:hypothetical protein
MGGASSRFGETDWETVDGGLKETSETVDGTEPTKHHRILTLKKQNIVNQRDFEVRSEMEELLYTSKPIEGTTKCFDLLDKDARKLFCIQTDSLRSQWQVYSYSPVWEGQVADPDAKGGDALYRKARIDISWNKYHGEVHPVMQSEDVDPMGVLSLDEEPVLRVEEIKSITAQYQSYVPKDALLDNAMHPPLVSWWVWERTPNLYQIKMHLAKGTDIALHCLVAITTNLVYVEKNSEE